MDNTARLKKKHILDLIAFMKTSLKSGRTGNMDEENVDKRSEYFDHTLFLGLMPDEDTGPYENHLSLTEQE
jgi:hypothetical protein